MASCLFVNAFKLCTEVGHPYFDGPYCPLECQSEEGVANYMDSVFNELLNT